MLFGRSPVVLRVTVLNYILAKASLQKASISPQHFYCHSFIVKGKNPSTFSENCRHCSIHSMLISLAAGVVVQNL